MFLISFGHDQYMTTDVLSYALLIALNSAGARVTYRGWTVFHN